MMRGLRTRHFLFVLSFSIAGLVGTGVAHRRSVSIGFQPDGSIVIPTGQALTPAGEHIEVSDRPLGMVLSPNGALMAVVTGANFGTRSLHIIDVNLRTLKQSISIGNSFVGVDFSPAGDKIYVGGGASNDVKFFTLQPTGLFAADGTLPIAGAAPSGLTLNGNGSRLYVALNHGPPGGGDRHGDASDRDAHSRRHLSVYRCHVGRRIQGVRQQLGRQDAWPGRLHRRDVPCGGRPPHRDSSERDRVRDRHRQQCRHQDH